jgi:hypothetical protein
MKTFGARAAYNRLKAGHTLAGHDVKGFYRLRKNPSSKTHSVWHSEEKGQWGKVCDIEDFTRLFVGCKFYIVGDK